MASPSRCLPALLVACACQSGTAGAPPHGVDTSSPSDGAATSTPAPTTSTSAPGTTASSAAGAVSLTLLAAGELEVSSAARSRLAVAAGIERKDEHGNWVRLENLDLGKGYRLVAQCTQSDTCITVAPGTPVRVEPWHGFDCSAQCNGTCRANAWLGPGTFHFVVRDCEGKSELASSPFELPGPEYASSPAFDRWKLAEDVVRGEAMRLSRPPVRWNPQDGLGGIAAKPGSALTATAIATLTTLLRAPRGFDDQIQKRCLTEHWVGVRLTRRLPTTDATGREDVSEIAFDFTCNKLFAVRGPAGADRRQTATHFDPSRGALLAWAKSVFPGDAELAAIR